VDFDNHASLAENRPARRDDPPDPPKPPHSTAGVHGAANAEPAATRQGNHANGSHDADVAALMPQVARLLRGEPNKALSSQTELRYGSHGSLSISLPKGTWYDHEEDRGGGVLDLIARETGRERKSDCLAWLRENGIEPNSRNGLEPKPSKRRVLARYNYHDASGAVRYQVERLKPKTFRQRRPNPSANGDWTYNLKGVDPLPYRLPEVIEAVARGRSVVIVEGEKDADALAGLGMVASCNSGGAGRWQRPLTKHFKGATVVIIGDNDEPGRRHVQHVATELDGTARSIRVLDLAQHWPDCPPKGDITDWLAADRTPEQLIELLAKAVPWSGEGVPGEKKPKVGRPPKTPKPGCPEIRLVRGERPRVVDEALTIISSRADLYERGGELVRVAGGGVEPVGPDLLLDYLDRHVNFRGSRRVRDDEIWETRDAPEWLGRRVAAKRVDAVLPSLRAVITAPTMRRDGSLLDSAGYDPATALYLMGGEGAWPGVPVFPTKAALQEAAKTVWKPFAEFPFVDDVARGAMLSTVLTAVMRQSLDGAPGTIFDAPAAGTGKTLLGFLVQALTGMPRQAIPECRDEDEVRKRILSTLRTGQPCMLLDNIRGQFGSASLEAMLTTDVYSDRLLGGSRMLTLPTSVMVMISGNNFRPAGDLWRRLLTVRMDAGIEAPERRSFSFEPFSHCRDNRQRIVAAALTLLRGFVAEGSPRTMPDRLASFDEWDCRIRQAVLWISSAGLMPEGAAVADPVGSIERAKKDEPERQKLGALLTLAHGVKRDTQWRVADLVGEARQAITQPTFAPEQVKALHSVLMEIAGERGEVNPRVLGRWIERQQMRRCGGLWVKRAGERWKTALWQVCGAPDPEATPAA